MSASLRLSSTNRTGSHGWKSAWASPGPAALRATGRMRHNGQRAYDQVPCASDEDEDANKSENESA
ncbi:hypothetical protein F0344_11970 [Streptomyces finlayi]|uniref:Uncharacterized protein n=1 Tax=Streptomyces finlayi TaxID=67296 RepID=A0A7G7BIR5_9ACTN|nr:hypothetical protein [Streptomyces finlayi]QNE75230.1 hypothetical protein F0344_11970 [Streptomyces finlayi]